ncbi:hypothetical protein [Kribbella speibonae]|uniref:Uncharacterized protein n=1 Tax=Kribbella speibonae TaxID=1572660 RepID=A0ABY1ZWK9_9ACTN|nr:hypothetical protein [Kribbella speibonae]TCC16213.1 hypothetical protein E0H58_40800 [Kribbella speibonae]
MRTLMSGPASVHYGQLYVQSGGRDPELPESFAGHQNGLCGAAVEGTLFLVTGLHTGDVGFGVELYDDAPPIDDSWEEIVEASFRPLGETFLTGFDSGYWPLELELVDYRARYCGWGMDAGHQAAPPEDGEPPVDRYLLQLWPAPPEPDRVIRQTSAQAAYWHDVARKTPPPPTPEQRAELQRARERREAEEREARNLESWGGSIPSERIQDKYMSVLLVQYDRPLLDDLDRATPETLVRIARWAARRGCVATGLDRTDWIATRLDQMDQGLGPRDLTAPPPGTFETDGPILVSTSGGAWPRHLSEPLQALTVIDSTYDDDPLDAAIDTLLRTIDAVGNGHQVITELRQAFPDLS